MKSCKTQKQPSILVEAETLVNGPRAQAYGPINANFSRWRSLCQATGRPGLQAITSEDLAIVMILCKLARDTNAPKRDNAVDIAGYASILDSVRGE